MKEFRGAKYPRIKVRAGRVGEEFGGFGNKSTNETRPEFFFFTQRIRNSVRGRCATKEKETGELRPRRAIREVTKTQDEGWEGNKCVHPKIKNPSASQL